MSPKDNPLLAAALTCAQRGWPVFPCHTPRNGQCSCYTDCGRHIGKHPRTEHGYKDATTDRPTIRAWWANWPDANIGIPTGRVSGLVGLDVDPRYGGDLTLAKLIAAHGPFPKTVESLTGGGGRHLLFMHPGGTIPNSQEKQGPGLDVRGDGGYIVVPPSLHTSGLRYAWKDSSHPDTVALSSLPGWLHRGMLQAKQPRRKKVEEDGTKEGSYAPYIQQLEGGLCGGIGWTDSDNKRELWEDINQRRDQLIRYLRRHWSGCCPTLSDAEDILQMTCMRLIANGEDGLVRDSWAWIIGALRNTCLSETRNARRRDALSLTANLPWILGETSPDVAERVILRDVLDKAFSLVREPYRDLLARQFVEGYTLRDLASMSGIPRSTLERHLTEAMDLVSAYLVAEGVLSPHALEPQREQLPVFDQLEQVLTSIGMTAPSMPWADGKTETVKRSS